MIGTGYVIQGRNVRRKATLRRREDMEYQITDRLSFQKNFWESNQRSHKDVDARWTQKRGKNYFGYKLHVCVDTGGKFIRKIVVTPANVHDSQHFEDLLDPESADRNVFADAGYTGAIHVENLEKSNFIPQICERKTCNHPLTDEQKASNRQKSPIRIRVEHVFGHMTPTVSKNAPFRAF